MIGGILAAGLLASTVTGPIWTSCSSESTGQKVSGIRYGLVSNEEAILELPKLIGWPGGRFQLKRREYATPTAPGQPWSTLANAGTKSDRVGVLEGGQYFPQERKLVLHLTVTDHKKGERAAVLKLLCLADDLPVNAKNAN